MAQNANVAQTSVGTKHVSRMLMLKKHNVRYMPTTSTFAHAQKTSTCEFHSLVELLIILLRNTLQNITKQ